MSAHRLTAILIPESKWCDEFLLYVTGRPLDFESEGLTALQFTKTSLLMSRSVEARFAVPSLVPV
jgi:hypothetical protein